MGLTVAIHQPHLFPWIPYLYKVAKSDLFVILDDAPFKKGGDQNRFRLQGKGEPFWVTATLRHEDCNKTLNRATISDEFFYEKLGKTLQSTYGRQTYFDEVMRKLDVFFCDSSFDFVKAAVNSLVSSLSIYGSIPKRGAMASGLGVYSKKERRVLDICKKVGATRYLCGTHGKDYLNIQDFTDAGIEVIEIVNDIPAYKDGGMSCLDYAFAHDNMKEYAEKHCHMEVLHG